MCLESNREITRDLNVIKKVLPSLTLEVYKVLRFDHELNYLATCSRLISIELCSLHQIHIWKPGQQVRVNSAYKNRVNFGYHVALDKEEAQRLVEEEKSNTIIVPMVANITDLVAAGAGSYRAAWGTNTESQAVFRTLFLSPTVYNEIIEGQMKKLKKYSPHLFTKSQLNG